MSTEQEIVLFESTDGRVSFPVTIDVDNEDVWLNRNQLADLFERDIKTIGKHINNALNEELAASRDATVAKFATVQNEGARSVTRNIEYYSLDLILSVGYRVKSDRGIEFRRWANSVLQQYIMHGHVENDRRLAQIDTVVKILSRSSEDMISGIADVLSEFTDGLALLDNYDHQTLSKPKGAVPEWVLTYDDARGFIDTMKFGETSELFGHEQDGSFKGVIQGLYQSFGGIDLYPSIQEKAANLLYLVVKDHCFTDGNKRIAAALFVYFLDENGALRDSAGRLVIQNNTLAAITLMIALSAPEEKEVMCTLVMNMLVESN